MKELDLAKQEHSEDDRWQDVSVCAFPGGMIHPFLNMRRQTSMVWIYRSAPIRGRIIDYQVLLVSPITRGIGLSAAQASQNRKTTCRAISFLSKPYQIL